MSDGVDINAFPPEIPPDPDGDDIGGDELDKAGAPARPAQGADEHGGASPAPADAQGAPPCDYCGQPAAIGIVYLATREREYSCMACHAAMLAQALHVAADEAETAEAPA